MMVGELRALLDAFPDDMEVVAQGEYDNMPIRTVDVVRTVISGDIVVIA